MRYQVRSDDDCYRVWDNYLFRWESDAFDNSDFLFENDAQALADALNEEI